MGPEEWRDLGGDEASRPTETTVLRIEHDAAVARANRAEAQAYDLRLALAREILDVFGVPYGTEDVRDAARRIVGERDTLAAALAEVRERASVIAYVRAWADTLEAYKPTGDEVYTAARLAEQLRAALAALPADLAEQRDARVRAEALLGKQLEKGGA